MFGTYFYNETIKRSVSIFGTLFNNIKIKKTKADGTVLTEQVVPISYGPKQKWLQRLNQDPKARDANITAMSLPRLAFEMTGFEYDATRQQNKLIRHSKTTIETDGVNRKYMYQPVPYNLNFTLSAMCKNMTDALQIVEQILPYFQPEYTVSMKMIDDLSDVRDVPIVLNNITLEDSYEGNYEERRVITYNLTFTMKVYFFGPVYNGAIVTNVIEREYINDQAGLFTTSQIDESGLVKEVKHYEPAFSAIANTVSNSTTITFDTAINSKISVGDEVFYTGNTPNPTISSIASDKLSIILNTAVTITEPKTIMFVGSVEPTDTFVVAETVTFYDDRAKETFSETDDS